MLRRQKLGQTLYTNASLRVTVGYAQIPLILHMRSIEEVMELSVQPSTLLSKLISKLVLPIVCELNLKKSILRTSQVPTIKAE